MTLLQLIFTKVDDYKTISEIDEYSEMDFVDLNDSEDEVVLPK